MKRLFLSLFAFLLLAPIMVQGKDVSEQDLKAMEQKMLQQSMEHKKLQAEATQINLELTGVSMEMIKAAKLIQSHEQKLSQMELELDRLKLDLADTEENFLVEDDNLIKTLSALQTLALNPTEALFVQPLSPVEIIRSAILLRETVPHLENNATKIKKELLKINEKKKNIENKLKNIQEQKNQLQKKHEEMRMLVQRKSKIRNSVEIESAQTKKEVIKLAGEAQNVRDLLKKLEEERLQKAKQQELERQRLAKAMSAEQDKIFALKKEQEKQSADLIKFKPQDITDTGKKFALAKSSLPMPAIGKITTKFGEHTNSGLTSKGMVVKTRNMAQVIAPFDGSVIFNGPFRGYGNLIIIDHGEGYVSLLAGLESIDVELGQMLLAGEPVGQMPSDGEAKLYVEIRKDSQPINPAEWIKTS